jgi:lysophospholipase L1-like esterase
VARWAGPSAAAAPASYITDWQAWEGEFYTVKSTAVGWPPWEDYNTDGLRDREHTIEKRPGTRRVACLGDSVTLGWGIRPDQAWPQVLEAQAAASGVDLDVMNVALGGWSTRQEVIAYRRIVRRYRPDQVLLGLCLNDVAEMQNNLSRPPRLVAQLYRRSALVRWIVGARRREIAGVEELFSSPASPQVREGWERVFAELRTLRDEVRADGASFAILVFPFRFQVALGAPAPIAQRTLAQSCRREGIPLLDLLPALASVGEAAFLDYDHLSPAGAGLVAEQVLGSSLLSGAGAAPTGGGWTAAEERRAAAARTVAMRREAGAPLGPRLVAAVDDPSTRPPARAAGWRRKRWGVWGPRLEPPCPPSSQPPPIRCRRCGGGRYGLSAGSGPPPRLRSPCSAPRSRIRTCAGARQRLSEGSGRGRSKPSRTSSPSFATPRAPCAGAQREPSGRSGVVRPSPRWRGPYETRPRTSGWRESPGWSGSGPTPRSSRRPS